MNILYNNGQSLIISKGETVLIPADLKEILLKPIKQTTILEIYIK
jgi:hypothetical protein